MVMYREVCPERVQNECPGGVWYRGFMSWGDTLILVISRGVQLYYGIAQFSPDPTCIREGVATPDYVRHVTVQWNCLQVQSEGSYFITLAPTPLPGIVVTKELMEIG